MLATVSNHNVSGKLKDKSMYDIPKNTIQNIKHTKCIDRSSQCLMNSKKNKLWKGSLPNGIVLLS